MRSRVVGMDPFRLAGLLGRSDADAERQTAAAPGGRSQTYLVPGENPLDRHTRTFAAIEVACLDLIGKAIGKPVCDVIGGRVRDEVTFSAYLFYKHGGGGGVGDDRARRRVRRVLDPQAMVRECKQMIAQYGFREIKLKGGVLDPEVEIATIRALREEFGPTYPLRIDPNCAWSVETSVQVGRGAQGRAVGRRLSGRSLRDARRAWPKCGARLLAEGNRHAAWPATSPSRASPTCPKRPANWMPCRSCSPTRITGAACGTCSTCRSSDEVLGMGLSMHSNSHLGISLMAMAHAAAACPESDLRLRHALSLADGERRSGRGRTISSQRRVRIPDKPGLGVELDYDQLARGRERYAKIPYRKRDDEAEMRKHVDPNWKRVLPSW